MATLERKSTWGQSPVLIEVQLFADWVRSQAALTRDALAGV
jgi:hypothetical protein